MILDGASSSSPSLRVVVVEPRQEWLVARQRRGLDGKDEMWDGVLHVTPAPSCEHQALGVALVAYFKRHWADVGEGVLFYDVNVRRRGVVPLVQVGRKQMPRDFRIPDLVLLRAGHEDRVVDGWVVGPPDCVFELRSPGDESYEKLPWYLALGIPEVVIIDRDTKQVEVLRRVRGRFAKARADRDGWTLVKQLDTELRTRTVKGAPVLELRRKSAPRRRGRA